MAARRLPLSASPRLDERRFQKQVTDLATLLGWRHWHDAATNAPRRCSSCGAVRRGPRNASGLPDLILIRRPRLIWAELKTDDGDVTPDQWSWLQDLAAAGQEVYLWRPSHWSQIERILSR